MLRATTARLEPVARPGAHTQVRFKSQLHRLKHAQHVAQLVQKRKITALDPYSRQVLNRNKAAVKSAFPSAESFDVASLYPRRVALENAAETPKVNKDGYGFGTDGWYHVGRTALGNLPVHSWFNSTKARTEISKISGSAVLLKRDLCRALDMHKDEVVIAPSGRKITVPSQNANLLRRWLEQKF